MANEIEVFRANAAATVNLAVTSSTGNVRFMADGGYDRPTAHVRLYNAGLVVVFVEFAPTSALAIATTTASFPLAPGATEIFRIARDQTFVAGITSSSTSTLYATQGYGA